MSSDNHSTIASEVVAASLGGAISASILYPLEVLKTRMQSDDQLNDNDEDKEESLDDSNKHNNDTQKLAMIPYARHLYQSEGPSVFYRGMEWSALQSAVEKALYFFAYEGLKRMVTSTSINASSSSSSSGTSISPLTNLTLGCLAEWAHLPVTLPLDCWTTQIQTTNNDTTAAAAATDNKSAMALLTAMLSDKGVRGMYKGLQAYVVLCFKPALQYTVYEQVKKLLLRSKNSKSRTHLSAAEAFVLGMVSRVVATLAVFPYVRAKVLLQTQQRPENGTDDSDPSANRTATCSIPHMLQELFQKGGLAALYQGIVPELTRGVLSSALMLMIKEKVAQLVQATMVGRRSNTSRALGR